MKNKIVHSVAKLFSFMCFLFVVAVIGCKVEISEVTLANIEVASLPTKSTYYVGEEFDSTGLVINAVYSDGSKKNVTTSCTLSGFSSTTASEGRVVTVSYVEGGATKTTTFTIVVKSVDLTEIKLTTTPTKTTYSVGDSFSSAGMSVTAFYSDGSSGTVALSSLTITGFDSSVATTSQTITVSFTKNSITKTVQFTIVVKDNPLTSIAITTQPTRVSYNLNDSFSTAGMVVTATYSDNSTEVIDNASLTITGFDSTAAVASQTVTVSYTKGTVTKSATLTVSIKDITVTSISVTTKPTTTTYNISSSFDSTGMVVTATYSDGTTAAVTGYSVSGFDSSTANASETITITYAGKTDTFTIVITTIELSSIAVTTLPSKTSYNTGDSFDASGIVVTATYSNESTKDVTASVSTSGFSSTTTGTKTITVSYTEGSVTKTTTFTVTIVADDAIVSTKYTTATTTATSGTQASWGALNCHDPKLFQDDDGTYYVYSTDASIGNAHQRGLIVRSSKDLINWTCSATSAIQSNWDSSMLSWLEQTSSTATTWAPTVIKQNGKYYMYHGIIVDTSNATTNPAAYIGLAIADSPTGPFKPAATYDSSTYKQSGLVRYVWTGGTGSSGTYSTYVGGEMTGMKVNSVSYTDGTHTSSTAHTITNATLAATGNWYDVTTTAYEGVTGLTGDFTVTYDVTLTSPGASNWQKWSFAFKDTTNNKGWYLRADAYSNDAAALGLTNSFGYGGAIDTTNTGITYSYTWDGYDSAATTNFHDVFAAGTEVIIKAAYTESTGVCVVTATVAGAVVYTATGTPSATSTSYTDCNNSGAYNTTTKTYDTSSNWNDGFGAIDPEFVFDVADTSSGTKLPKTYTVGTNTCYAMTFGSWKGGIALIYVDAQTLKPVDKNGNELDTPLDELSIPDVATKIAGGYGAAYEGAQLIYNSDTGYYYVFVSMGELNYEYRVGVGRCATIDGTYVDAGGTSMNFTNTTTAKKYHAIGSKIIGAAELNGEYSWRCPGGQSILRTSDGKIMFACHTRTNFYAGYYFYLQVRQMFFTSDGWPVLNQNEYYAKSYNDNETLTSLSVSDVAGTYDTILTVRGTATSSYTPFGGAAGTYNTADETPTASVELVLGTDGTISGGTYTGTWALAADGYTITLSLKNSSGTTLGTFKGYALHATDWARKGSVYRKTITFTTIDSTSGDTEAGEYFWGNKQ